MATLYSDIVTADVPTYSRPAAGIPLVAFGTYTLTAALAINDVIQMVKVPAGAKIVGITLATTDLDTGGSPTITLDVGDDGDADRFVAASTIGQAGGATNDILFSGYGYAYTAENTVDVLVKAAPATGATSGTIELAVTYIY
jgi:hypothetical protein